MDVCSVHHNNMFLRYSVSLLGYGFYGDVLTDSERKRWMGPARYDLSGRNTTRLKMFSGTICDVDDCPIYLRWRSDTSRCENVPHSSLLWRDSVLPASKRHHRNAQGCYTLSIWVSEILYSSERCENFICFYLNNKKGIIREICLDQVS